MSERRRYVPRPDRPVTAVPLDFEPDGFAFHYRKWGRDQRAKAGDWIVRKKVLERNNVYTVDADVFERTYRAAPEHGAGAYVKTTPVWAERADRAGTVSTKEGSSDYQAGDFLVWNSRDDGDRYAVPAGEFEDSYVAADDAEP